VRSGAGKRRQAGVTLLVMIVILGMGICAFLISALNSASLNETTRTRNRHSDVLQQARSALIGYVAKEVLDLSENIPGRLPCPESPGDAGTNNEGRAGSTCDPTFATNKNIGRLPWRTLGIDKLVDASNEPLWYAVSPNWVPGSATPVINSGTAGQLTVDGIGDIVAVIIAPGRPLDVNPNANQTAAGCQARQQSRNDRSHNPASGTNPDYRDYLECQNASNPIDLTFGSTIPEDPTNAVLNDQVVYITAKDILNAIQGPVAERMQRTVAPLLSEFSDLWPSGTFLPYARAFATPENNLPVAQHCGPTATTVQLREGLLPIAPNAAPCASSWTNFSITGSVTPTPSPPGCTTLVTTNVECKFKYYQLVGLGLLLPSTGNIDVTLQATAPHAAASFRKPLQASDVIVPGGITTQAVTFAPQTDGDARLTVQVRVTGTNLCDNFLIGALCALLPGLLTAEQTVAIQFPQLTTPLLQGTKLSTAVRAAHPFPTLPAPQSYNLLAPASSAPHYWFMQNQWYRYTYYAVSPNASAAATGGNITVNGFPAANGGASDKRFVLAVMGPAVTGQTRGPAAALNQYVEGDNAASTAIPRVFAYQVYAASGNDRLATCPFTDGAVPCD
jgi:hypothetical protein